MLRANIEELDNVIALYDIHYIATEDHFRLKRSPDKGEYIHLTDTAFFRYFGYAVRLREQSIWFGRLAELNRMFLTID